MQQSIYSSTHLRQKQFKSSDLSNYQRPSSSKMQASSTSIDKLPALVVNTRDIATNGAYRNSTDYSSKSTSRYLKSSQLRGSAYSRGTQNFPTTEDLTSSNQLNLEAQDRKSNYYKSGFNISDTSSQSEIPKHKSTYSIIKAQLPPLKQYTPQKITKTQSWKVRQNETVQTQNPTINNPMIRSQFTMFRVATQANSESITNQLEEHESTDVVSDSGSDEHNIYDIEPLPQIELKDKLITFLELLKFRYETYEKDKSKRQPTSCNEMICLSQQLARKHKKTWLKWFGCKKIRWLDFRDFTSC